SYVAVKRDEEAALFPNCGNELEFKLEVSATGADRKVHLEGEVIDFNGIALDQVTWDVEVKSGETESKPVVVKPTERNAGPFYLRGKWNETNGNNQGDFYCAAGQANWRRTVEDFELLRYPKPGPLQNTAESKHGGQRGLLMKIPAPPPVVVAPGQLPPKPEQPKLAVPLNLGLPGRAVKLGVWLKASAATSLTVQARDPGVEIRQSVFFDNWNIGPIEIAAGDWRYVEIPMPGFSRPKAEMKPHGEGNGVVDNPLTILSFEFSGDAGTVLMMDDIGVLSQGEQSDALTMRAIISKPTGLLYRNDAMTLAINNAWLWGKASEGLDVEYSASLEDVNGKKYPLTAGKATIAPGGETFAAAPIKDLPVGPYQLVASVKAGELTITTPKSRAALLVYEPTGKALDDVALYELLSDRNKVLLDLGFKRDPLIVPWHSVDGAPSVEPFPGAWSFDFITPTIDAKRKAGLEVIGTLGFCALWADPGAVFNPYTNAWNGSVYTMPSRTIYWEEYVRRTVEEFAGKIDTWVVWDRPDSDVFNATPQEYAEKMLEVAYKAAKRANPNVKIISGGITRENIEKYLVGMSEAGAHRYLSAIGILPSSAPLSPEDGYMDVVLARAQRIRAQEHIEPELWVLELGWPTGDGQADVSEIDQALYVPRGYIMCRAQGIKNIVMKADRTQVAPRRDSADLIYPEGTLTGLKPAAVSVKTVVQMVENSEFLREVFLSDRNEGMSRGYLFKRPDGKILLTAWRKEGESTLTLPANPVEVIDTFGNKLAPAQAAKGPEITLRPAVTYATFNAMDVAELAKGLERRPLHFADAPESLWKSDIAFHLDVGDPADEALAQYKSTGSRLVGPIDSYYHTEYGQHAVDTGRHFKGSESFVVDVSNYGDASLLLRKRINYSVPNQLVRVYCNDRLVGQWFAFKRDRRYRWRDIEIVIPNSFFAGQKMANLRFESAGDGEATSYYYWGGPIKTRTVCASDMALLVNTSGYGPGVNRDKNILGGEMKFFNRDKVIDKGLGTNAAESLAQSLVVIPLNKQFKRFKATVGIDAAANGRGSVRFRIGDGTKQLYDSQDMNYYTEPREIDIDVSDAIILMLWVGDTGDGHQNDIANWANARLELK
ncbi:MAG TPA: NPCBM/NEW2 domain-containing protein, partial [Tepidisphaeraceae bacterium]